MADAKINLRYGCLELVLRIIKQSISLSIFRFCFKRKNTNPRQVIYVYVYNAFFFSYYQVIRTHNLPCEKFHV